MIDALLRGRLPPRAFPRANLDRGARGQGRAVNRQGCGLDLLNSVTDRIRCPHDRNRRTVRSGWLGWRRRSLQSGPSITASQLRQRAEAVKADPNEVRGAAKRVASLMSFVKRRDTPPRLSDQ